MHTPPGVWEKLEHCGYEHLLRTVNATAMQMTIPIAIFHGFSLASFMQADRIHHFLIMLVVECLEDVVWRLWRDIAATHKIQQPVMWEGVKFGAEDFFEEMQELFRE